jgi:hypothetical protein
MSATRWSTCFAARAGRRWPNRGCRSAHTSLHFPPFQECSGAVVRVRASGRPPVALKRASVRIALECVQKGRPGDLVDDDRGCERRVAPRRCKK